MADNISADTNAALVSRGHILSIHNPTAQSAQQKEVRLDVVRSSSGPQLCTPGLAPLAGRAHRGKTRRDEP